MSDGAVNDGAVEAEGRDKSAGSRGALWDENRLDSAGEGGWWKGMDESAAPRGASQARANFESGGEGGLWITR